MELDPITARPRGHAYADFLEEWAAEMVLQGAPWRDRHIEMGVSENRLNPIVPNGFADHYPYEKWLFHWEYKPNIFRQTHMDELVGKSGRKASEVFLSPLERFPVHFSTFPLKLIHSSIEMKKLNESEWRISPIFNEDIMGYK